MKSSRRQRELLEFAMDGFKQIDRQTLPYIEYTPHPSNIRKPNHLMNRNKWDWEKKKKSAEARKANIEIEIANATEKVEKVLWSLKNRMKEEVKEGSWEIILFSALMEIMGTLKAIRAKNAIEKDIAEANAKIKYYTANLYKIDRSNII